jgi:protein-S-isoprenylcysteine O-methyltransferase Ste14
MPSALMLSAPLAIRLFMLACLYLTIAWLQVSSWRFALLMRLTRVVPLRLQRLAPMRLQRLSPKRLARQGPPLTPAHVALMVLPWLACLQPAHLWWGLNRATPLMPLELAGWLLVLISWWWPHVCTRRIPPHRIPLISVPPTNHLPFCQTGPYAFVRHPMYAGYVLWLLGVLLPLLVLVPGGGIDQGGLSELPRHITDVTALLKALPLMPLLPFMINLTCGVVFCLGLHIRINAEEAFWLKAHSTAYTRYCEKTRYRLLPGLY